MTYTALKIYINKSMHTMGSQPNIFALLSPFSVIYRKGYAIMIELLAHFAWPETFAWYTVDLYIAVRMLS